MSRNLKEVKEQPMQNCDGTFQGNVSEAETFLKCPRSSKREVLMREKGARRDEVWKEGRGMTPRAWKHTGKHSTLDFILSVTGRHGRGQT